MTPEDKDHLKEFIKSNRAAFDTEVPSNKVWNGIAKNLELTNTSSAYQWMWKVAAVVFFCTTGYLLLDKTNNAAQEKTIAQKEVASTEEFEATEAYYVSLISEKREQIFDHTNFSEAMEGMYEVDIEQLDAMYQVLKLQYASSPSNELQEAMTLNLLVRIDILNQQLSEVDGFNKKEDKVVEQGA